MFQKLLLSTLFCATYFISLTQPNICINEYSASNVSTYPDNSFEYHDWLELYNKTAGGINIGGWYMSDNPANLTKWQIPAGTTIPAYSYLLIFASSLNAVIGGEIHADFKLTQCKGEWLILSANGLAVTDSMQLVRTQKDHSRGRITNGNTQWTYFETPTPGYSNAFSTPALAYTPKPTIAPAAGFYGSAVSVSITASGLTANETIYYTLDGSNPATSVTRIAYTAPFMVNNTKIVRSAVVSTNTNLLTGFHDNSTFFINSTHTLPVISVASENYTGFFDGSFWGNPVTSFELFGDNGGALLWEMEGEMRSHGNDSWAFPQKGIRFYAKDDYGYENNIDVHIFNDSVSANSNYGSKTETDVLIIRNAGSDNYPGIAPGALASCHLRDAFAQTLARRYNLHLDTRRYQPCIVYINGQYWGLYEMRERVDSDYTNYYYGQAEKNVDMLEYWGGLDVRYGSDTAWTNIYNFMANNNLAIPSNYTYVQNQIDINSFIDYFILNTFLVNSDWLNWNTAWWRGRKMPNNVKWKYQLWDMDNIFNLGQNYTGLGTTTWQSDPCEPGTTLFVNDPNIHHSDMYRALFDNPDFVQQYYNRYADLAGTVFNCDTLLNHLDALAADIAPEMPQHIARWSGSYAQWQSNLQLLRTEIQGKCGAVITQLVDCDSTITGAYNVVFMSDPPQAGQVKVNTVTPPLPYQATYFSGINTQAEALPFSGYEFSHWTLNNHIPSPSTLDSIIQFSVTTTDTIIAHFSPLLGTHALLDLEQFNIFPNPSDGNFNIQIQFNEPQDAILEITNSLGSRITTLPISGAQMYLNMNLNYLPAGLYFATIHSGKGNSSRKFVVSR